MRYTDSFGNLKILLEGGSLMIVHVAFVKTTYAMLDFQKYWNSISSAKLFRMYYLFVIFYSFGLDIKKINFDVAWFQV